MEIDKLRAERERLSKRMAEIDVVLNAAAILEKHGLRAVPVDGKPPETASQAEVRAAVESWAAKTPTKPFTIGDIRSTMKPKRTVMTVRNAVNMLVEQGFVTVSERGGKGRAAQYVVSPDLVTTTIESL